MMNAQTATCYALITLGPACLTLAVALLLGVDPRAAAFGSLGAGVIACSTGLAQHWLVAEGLAKVLGSQLIALVMRLVLALVALLLGRSAGIADAAVVCMALPLAAAVMGDAALLARASARQDVMAEDPARA